MSGTMETTTVRDRLPGPLGERRAKPAKPVAVPVLLPDPQQATQPLTKDFKAGHRKRWRGPKPIDTDTDSGRVKKLKKRIEATEKLLIALNHELAELRSKAAADASNVRIVTVEQATTGGQ
jgi:hypothetical protein